MTLPTYWGINQFRERAERNRSLRAQRRQALLETLQRRIWLYPVEAAEVLGLPGVSGYTMAKSLLKSMERDGELVSELRPSPTRQGPGRRYYRLANKPPARAEGNDQTRQQSGAQGGNRCLACRSNVESAR